MRLNYDGYCMVQLARMYYTLRPEALIVLHVGGYDGTWDANLVDVLEGVPIHEYSVEPHPANFKLMEQTFTGRSNLHALKYAVSSVPGWCSLYGNDNEKSQSCSFVKGFNEGRGRINVEAVTLSNLYKTLQLSMVHLLRLNCEGSEFTIFDGACDVDFLQRTMMVNLCLHGKISSMITREMNMRKQEITKRIQSAGFRMARGPDHATLLTVKDHVWQAYIREGML